MNKQPTPEERDAAFDALRQDYVLGGQKGGDRLTDPHQQDVLFGLVIRWLETRSPQFMDQAVLYCHEQGLPILPSLLEHVAASVAARRSYKPADKLANESEKNQAFRLMANLVAHEITIERASEVAAVWMHDRCAKPITAGTLKRDFSKGGGKMLSDRLKAAIAEWDEFADPQLKAEWLAIERNCREIKPHEKGERH